MPDAPRMIETRQTESGAKPNLDKAGAHDTLMTRFDSMPQDTELQAAGGKLLQFEDHGKYFSMKKVHP